MSDRPIRLRPRKERPVVLGHPWIFSGAIADLDPQLEPGALVAVRSASGDLLGRGYVNPRCAIAVRMLTSTDEPLDASFWQRRVAAALALRRGVVPPETDTYRLLNGEAHFLPRFLAHPYSAAL